jgi:hypothetical protein
LQKICFIGELLIVDLINLGLIIFNWFEVNFIEQSHLNLIIILIFSKLFYSVKLIIGLKIFVHFLAIVFQELYFSMFNFIQSFRYFI